MITHDHNKHMGTGAGRWFIGVQIALILIVGALLSLRPLPGEPVLAVPILSSVAPLINSGGTLVGSGRIPGSLVLSGHLPSATQALLRHHVIFLRASWLLCGEPPSRTAQKRV